jgi:anti-sigma factor RsiW
MVDCQRLDPFVTAYVDGELPDPDRRTVDAHLRVCPACHSRVAAERAVHELIRARTAALHATRAPDALRAACANPYPAPRTLASHEMPASWPRRLAPFALAASLVTVVGGAFLYQATDRSARLMAAELTADHLKCFAMNSALGTHQAAAAVEGAMMSSFDWRMQLPDDPSRAGLELVGARPCLYGEGKVAHIMYRHGGRPVSLFMLPDSVRTQELVEVLGHEAAIWCAGNRTFVLIAREPRPEVERMASFVRAAIR